MNIECLDVNWFESSVVQDIPVGDAFNPWRLKILSQDEFLSLGHKCKESLSNLQLAYLCNFNILAPTSHNTIPQRFHIANGKLRIYLDRMFVLAESDPTGRQATVSIGCGLANTDIAARCYGWDTKVSLLIDQELAKKLSQPFKTHEQRYVPIVDLSFLRNEHQLDQSWLYTMKKRKILRAEFDDTVKMPPEMIQELKNKANQYPEISIDVLTDKTSLLFIGKFQELADTTVFNREGFSLELGQWLLPNDSESPIGMRGREFGLSDTSALRIHKGLLRQTTLLPDEIAGVAKASNVGIRSSSAIAVISVKEDVLSSRLAAGRLYEEIALWLQQQGFFTAMHAAITEVEAPNLALRGRLRSMRRPTVIFRIGIPLSLNDTQRYHASRPTFRDLLLTDQSI